MSPDKIFKRDIHGELQCYRENKCKCDLCRAANKNYVDRMTEKRLVKGNTPHGTSNGYTNYACRCIECKTAQVAHTKQYKLDFLARAAKDPSIMKHGNYFSSGTLGCPCDICREFYRSRERARKARYRRANKDKIIKLIELKNSIKTWTFEESEYIATEIRGKSILLIHEKDIKEIPYNTVLYSIMGEKITKGKKRLMSNTQDGHLAYGILRGENENITTEI